MGLLPIRSRRKLFKMRILYIPTYSNKNVWNCSHYLYSSYLVREIVEKNKDTYVYYCALDIDYDYPELKHDRVKLIYINYEKSLYTQIVSCPDIIYDLFNEISGQYYVDVIITERPGIIPFIRSKLFPYVDKCRTDIVMVYLNAIGLNYEMMTYLNKDFISIILLSYSITIIYYNVISGLLFFFFRNLIYIKTRANVENTTLNYIYFIKISNIFQTRFYTLIHRFFT